MKSEQPPIITIHPRIIPSIQKYLDGPKAPATSYTKYFKIVMPQIFKEYLDMPRIVLFPW